MSRRRFTTAEYSRLTEIGVFAPDDRIELLDGWRVMKATNTPFQATAIGLLEDALNVRLCWPWGLRIQLPIILSRDNAPEPDCAVVSGPHRRFSTNHPGPADIALLVEVAELTLDQDRGFKQEIYARDRIPQYWIVNLIDRSVEVYSEPHSGRTHAYKQVATYHAGSSIPLRIAGNNLDAVAVDDLMP